MATCMILEPYLHSSVNTLPLGLAQQARVGAIKTCSYAVSLLLQVVTCSRNAEELEKGMILWPR